MRDIWNLRRIRLIQELREAREELLNINFATDTTNRIGVSRPYALLDNWYINWTQMFNRFDSIISGSIDIAIHVRMHGYQQITDVEIFHELRPDFPNLIPFALTKLSPHTPLHPLLPALFQTETHTPH